MSSFAISKHEAAVGGGDGMVAFFKMGIWHYRLMREK